MQQNERVAICAVAGMGGIGKTELALQYARRYSQCRDVAICRDVAMQRLYQGGVCWLQARGVDLGIQIVDFARTYLQLWCPNDEPPNRLETLTGWWVVRPDLGAAIAIEAPQELKEIIGQYILQN